jgi:hypothetical protein
MVLDERGLVPDARDRRAGTSDFASAAAFTSTAALPALAACVD